MGTKNRKGRTPEAQAALPGVIEKIQRLPNLTKACRQLQAQRSELADLRKDLGDTKQSILSQMHAAGLDFYPTDGKIFRTTAGKETIVIEDYEGPSIETEEEAE